MPVKPSSDAAPSQADGPEAQMTRMITGYWVTQIVHGAARFSVADHLRSRSMTAAEIAAAEESDATAMFWFLRACAALGLVRPEIEGRFSGTPLLATLRKDSPQSLRGFALSQPAPGHWLSWGRFTDALKTGKGRR